MIWLSISSQYKKILTTLISATSANPPTENLKNFLFKARAIERPMLVLPTPGGPDRQMIFPVNRRETIIWYEEYRILERKNENYEPRPTSKNREINSLPRVQSSRDEVDASIKQETLPTLWGSSKFSNSNKFQYPFLYIR